MHPLAIDHLVLTVSNIDATVAFYGGILGFSVESFAPGRIALRAGNQKINLHQAGREFEPKALHPTPGSCDLCILVSEAMEVVAEHLRSHGLKIVEGPVRRTGACSPIESIYVRDPDGNLVEIGVACGPREVA